MTQTSAIKPPTCPHCGNVHVGEAPCPRIKAIEYHPDGSTKRVEYLTPADHHAPSAATGLYPLNPAHWGW